MTEQNIKDLLNNKFISFKLQTNEYGEININLSIVSFTIFLDIETKYIFKYDIENNEVNIYYLKKYKEITFAFLNFISNHFTVENNKLIYK